MKAELTGVITVSLSIEEALMIARALGKTSGSQRMYIGMTQEESDQVATLYGVIDDSLRSLNKR